MQRWTALLLVPLASAVLAGPWVHEQTVAPGVGGEPEGNDLFGTRIALDGDVLVVGAFSDEIELVPGQGEAGNVGSVYVFRRSGNAWQFEQRLIAPDAEAGGWFGFDVAAHAGRLVVGAPNHDTPEPGVGGNVIDQGAAYVYRRDAAAWVLEQKLAPALTAAPFARFGHAVAMQDDSVVVGLPDWNGGAADVFVRNGPTWSAQARLLPTTPYAGPNAFGRSVAIDGATVVVGAPTEDNGGIGNGDSGAVYVFVRAAQTWSQQARLLPTPSHPGQAFGEAVAVYGHRALVGARDETVNALSSAGAVYDYARTAGIWNTGTRIVAPMPGASFRFGNSVALSAARAVVGSDWHDSVTGQQQGAVFVFDDGGSGFMPTQTLVAPAATRGAFNQFGADVALDAARVAIGEPGVDGSSYNAGRAHTFGEDAGAIFRDGFD